jgi:hypothetical protein
VGFSDWNYTDRVRLGQPGLAAAALAVLSLEAWPLGAARLRFGPGSRCWAWAAGLVLTAKLGWLHPFFAPRSLADVYAERGAA